MLWIAGQVLNNKGAASYRSHNPVSNPHTMAPSISDIIRETTGFSLNSSEVAKPQKSIKADAVQHPLDDLTADEITSACSIVKANRAGKPLWIKIATLREPVSQDGDRSDSLLTFGAEQGGSHPLSRSRARRLFDSASSTRTLRRCDLLRSYD